MDPSSKDVPAPTPSAGGSSPKAKSSKLNPDAKEWNPLIERTPEEDRTLFLTFSKGYPLSEDQIIRFFNEYMSYFYTMHDQRFGLPCFCHVSKYYCYLFSSFAFAVYVFLILYVCSW